MSAHPYVHVLRVYVPITDYVLLLYTQVSKEAYDQCDLTLNVAQPTAIINCSAPLTRRRYTLLFENFQAIPYTPEFKAGSRYYFISKFDVLIPLTIKFAAFVSLVVHKR
jgi:hypothetical protein